MCGIAGLLSTNISQTALEKASSLLAHRGPDDTGYYLGQRIGIIATRLSIIDLTGGHQPIGNEDKSIWLTCNGEIVNSPELRRELQQAGHQFRTKSDIEVILHGYEEWGVDIITRLRGMFAFTLWDNNRQKLILARDRFGIKPLYYSQIGSQFAFSSEIRPLFHLLPTLNRQTSIDALRSLFSFGFIPSPMSAFRGVHKLPAGHSLTIENNQVTILPYWQLNFPVEGQYLSISPEEAAEQFMAHLWDAVASWRLSDVPVGSLLSGGIDSAALAALLTEISGPIHTFHISFEANSHDESTFAKAASQAIGSLHQTINFNESSFDLLPKIIAHLEEPQCSATSVPIYLLYQVCREADFKVLLTGEGADELLGGYHWFDGDRRIRPLLALPRPLRRLLSLLPANASEAGRRVLQNGEENPLDRFFLWQRVAAPEVIQNLFNEPDPCPSIPKLPEGLAQRLNGRHPLNQFLLLETQTRMVDFINFEIDRMSMANSVEARPPFLDHRLWEFCAQLPPNFKLKPGMNKFLLRKGMEGILPATVLKRPKKGLSTPHARWWRKEQLPVWAEEQLRPAALKDSGYFNPKFVNQLRQEHQSGKTDFSRVLTGVLTTQLWHYAMQVNR